MRWHKKGLTPAPGEDRGFYKGEDRLDQGEPVSEVVGGGEGRGEQVSQPSNDFGGVEELSFPFNGGC